MDTPTILLVQGAFQTPSAYSALRKILISHGHPVFHPTLPSCTNTASPYFPATTLIDDALAIRLKLTKLIEYEHRDVIIIMHSYGGLAGSEAIIEDHTHTHRSARGLKGGILYLFFFAAFLIPKGESFHSAFGRSPNYDVCSDGRFYLLDGAGTIYNDLPEDEAEMWESKMVPQSYAVQRTVLTKEAWKAVPSTYLVCENDLACPAQFQQEFAAMARSTVMKCTAGHSPMLSQPEVLVKNIEAAIQTALEGSLIRDLGDSCRL